MRFFFVCAVATADVTHNTESRLKALHQRRAEMSTVERDGLDSMFERLKVLNTPTKEIQASVVSFPPKGVDNAEASFVRKHGSNAELKHVRVPRHVVHGIADVESKPSANGDGEDDRVLEPGDTTVSKKPEAMETLESYSTEAVIANSKKHALELEALIDATLAPPSDVFDAERDADLSARLDIVMSGVADVIQQCQAQPGMLKSAELRHLLKTTKAHVLALEKAHPAPESPSAENNPNALLQPAKLRQSALETAREALNAGDVDGDGMMNVNEFQQQVTSSESFRNVVFHAYERDQDSKMDAAPFQEVNEVAAATSDKKTPLDIVREVVTAGDMDGDGTMNFDEFDKTFTQS